MTRVGWFQGVGLVLVLACGAGEPPAAPMADVPEVTASPDTPEPPDVSDVPDVPDVPDVADVEEPPEETVEVTEPPDAGPTAWRSALYPEDWTPAFTDAEGRFLHDFSYAGYHGGEELKDVFGGGFGISPDSSGVKDATAAIQGAIDNVAASGGGVVYLPAGLYRVDGVLKVSASHVVLRGEGPNATKIYFTKSEGMAYQSHLTFAGTLTSDLEAPLAKDGAVRSAVVEVTDAADLAPGDTVDVGWVITPAFVEEHGMTALWKAFNDTWQPFFHRTVVTVEGNQVTLDVPLRYPAKVSNQASLRRTHGWLSECGVEHLGLANAVGWDAAWEQKQVHVLEMSGVHDSWVKDVASFSPPSAPADGSGKGAHLQNGGLLLALAERITVADVHLALAENRGDGGCGYLFELRQSSEVLIRDSTGIAGRHNFIQNWGFGTTGCVFLRVTSKNGGMEIGKGWPPITGASEFHHSLATANLMDSCVVDDGWNAVNRRLESTGAGHTATMNVFWAPRGTGKLRSAQYGQGYVIGSAPALKVSTVLDGDDATGTAPEDFTEGLGQADLLSPTSLYEDQRARRLGL